MKRVRAGSGKEGCRFLSRGLSTGLALCLLLTCFFSGCSPKKEEGPSEDNVHIYYVNTSEDALYPVPYRLDSRDVEGRVKELMKAFTSIPESYEASPALDTKTVYIGHRIIDNILYLHFDNNYKEMKPSREILCRAALAKTFCQLPEIRFIGIYSGDQMLSDANGNPIVVFSADDFIDSISDIHAYESLDFTLYFAKRGENVLVKENRRLMVHTDTSREELLLKELIKGPGNPNLEAVIHPDTEVLGVTLTNQTYTVDFDQNLQNPMPEVDAYTAVYSVVNSLLGLGKAQRVQILIEGKGEEWLWGEVSLETPFSLNTEFIDSKE